MSLLVNLIGIAVIGFVVYWFWLSRPNRKSITAGSNEIEIIVADGVYQPAAVKSKVNETVRFRFTRKDVTPCAEQVIFSDFDFSKALPLNEPTEFTLTPTKPGEFEFTCQMGMYRGRWLVE